MTQLVSVSDYERRASEVLPRSPWQYYQSGAEKEHTLQLNKSAYDRWARYCAGRRKYYSLLLLFVVNWRETRQLLFRVLIEDNHWQIAVFCYHSTICIIIFFFFFDSHWGTWLCPQLMIRFIRQSMIRHCSVYHLSVLVDSSTVIIIIISAIRMATIFFSCIQIDQTLHFADYAFVPVYWSMYRNDARKPTY